MLNTSKLILYDKNEGKLLIVSPLFALSIFIALYYHTIHERKFLKEVI